MTKHCLETGRMATKQMLPILLVGSGFPEGEKGRKGNIGSLMKASSRMFESSKTSKGEGLWGDICEIGVL